MKLNLVYKTVDVRSAFLYVSLDRLSIWKSQLDFQQIAQPMLWNSIKYSMVSLMRLPSGLSILRRLFSKLGMQDVILTGAFIISSQAHKFSILLLYRIRWAWTEVEIFGRKGSCSPNHLKIGKYIFWPHNLKRD